MMRSISGMCCGRARLDVRLLDPQCRRILVHEADEARGQVEDALAVLGRALDDLVVDVGDVAHVGDREAARTQPAAHDVEHDHDARVPDVAVVVDGHAAHVHAHLARLDGYEILLLARERVVDLQHAGEARRVRRA